MSYFIFCSAVCLLAGFYDVFLTNFFNFLSGFVVGLCSQISLVKFKNKNQTDPRSRKLTEEIEKRKERKT